MSTRIGPENDLSAKLILLNIKNEKQFIDLCNINKTMRKLTQWSTDFWVDRIDRYYPEYKYLKEKFNLSWQQIYPVIVCMNYKYFESLANYFFNIHFDLTCHTDIFIINFIYKKLFSQYCIQITSNNKSEEFKKLMIFDIEINVKSIICQYADMSVLFDVYDKKELIQMSRILTPEKKREFLDLYIQKFEISYNILICAFFGDNIGLQKYKYLLTEEICNKYLLYTCFYGERISEHMLMFMGGHQIQIHFNDLLPTNAFINHLESINLNIRSFDDFLQHNQNQTIIYDDFSFNSFVSAHIYKYKRLFSMLHCMNINMPQNIAFSDRLSCENRNQIYELLQN